MTSTRTAVTAALVVVVASIVAFAGIMEGVGESGDVALADRPTMAWFVAHRDAVATSLAQAISTVGGKTVLPIIAAVTVALLLWRRRFDEALLLTLALGGAEAVALVIKHVVDRARPPAVDVVGPVETTLSFPSGHAVGTAAFTLGLAYLWWRRSPRLRRALAGFVVALLATVLMSASRLYLGDHWFTDVLAGAVLGVGALGVVVLADLWLRRHGPAWARPRASVAAPAPPDERGDAPR